MLFEQQTPDETKVLGEGVEQIQTDCLLVQRFLAGDISGFNTLILRHQESVKKHLLQRGIPEHDVDDVSQEIFMRVHRYVHKFHQESLFTTWLYQITYHAFLDYCKKTKRYTKKMDAYSEKMAEELSLNQSNDPYHETYQYLVYQRFLAAVLTLPEIFQQVVALREIDDLKYEDIAKALNLSEGTVRSRISRSRRRLRQLLHLDITESFA